MTVFFTCIIFIGIGLTVFSLILMLYEKKRLHDYRNDLKDKKDQLISVIEDAEELIEEMNRFSDYVVTQIEERNNALMDNIAIADLKIRQLESVSGKEAVVSEEPELVLTAVYDESSITKILEEDKPNNDNENSAYQNKGKVLTFDLKRREIIKLARAGMESTEIARILNCGKGEIELIAKMGR